MNILLHDSGFKDLLKVFGTISISLIIGILIISGYGVLAGGIYIVILFFLFLKNAETIFLCWFLLSPLLDIDSLSFLIINNHPIITFDRAVIGILFLFVLIEVTIRKKSLLSMNNLEKAMILFSIVIIYSIINKTIFKISGTRVFIDSYLCPFTIYFLAKNLITSDKSFNKFINILVIIGSYLSLMGIYEYITGKDIFFSPEGLVSIDGFLHVNGPYTMVSTFGVNLAFCFMIVLYKFVISKNLEEKNLNKYFYFLMLLSTSLAVFFCFYRGIWIALLLGLVSWFIIRRSGAIKLFYFTLILAILIIPNFSKLESTRLFRDRILNVKTIESRFDIYSRAYDSFKKSPIDGVGFENYPETEHNFYIYILCETGIIGAVSLVILIFMIIFYNYKYLRTAKCFFDKEFSAVSFSIVIIFLITWTSQNLGYYSHINTIFYAILGVMINRLSKQLSGEHI